MVRDDTNENEWTLTWRRLRSMTKEGEVEGSIR